MCVLAEQDGVNETLLDILCVQQPHDVRNRKRETFDATADLTFGSPGLIGEWVRGRACIRLFLQSGQMSGLKLERETNGGSSSRSRRFEVDSVRETGELFAPDKHSFRAAGKNSTGDDTASFSLSPLIYGDRAVHV